MKFKFCGDLDCPDWVLAEMNIMSKITSVRMKLLVVQVLNEMLGGAIDYAKVSKLVSNANWEESDIKASIAAISFILANAAKFSVESDTLATELQQLGLPKEHSISLCKSYKTKAPKLQERLRQQSLRGPTLAKLDWRLDYVISSSSLQLRMAVRDVDGKIAVHAFEVEDGKFSVLLSAGQDNDLYRVVFVDNVATHIGHLVHSELKQAKTIMDAAR